MFNVSALLLYDVPRPATPLTNGAINQTLRQVKLSQRLVNRAPELSWIVNIDKPFVIEPPLKTA